MTLGIAVTLGILIVLYLLFATPVKNWRANLKSKSSRTKMTGITVTLGILIVLYLLFALPIENWVENWKSKPQIPEMQVTVTPKSVTDKKWVYTFSKPEGVQGLDSRLRDNRNIPCYAKITAYDDNRFDWELSMPSIGHKAYYFWLRRRQPQGEWERDDKANQGSWSMMPDEISNGQPISFWGWETNLKGERMFIRLRAID